MLYLALLGDEVWRLTVELRNFWLNTALARFEQESFVRKDRGKIVLVLDPKIAGVGRALVSAYVIEPCDDDFDDLLTKLEEIAHDSDSKKA